MPNPTPLELPNLIDLFDPAICPWKDIEKANRPPPGNVFLSLIVDATQHTTINDNLEKVKGKHVKGSANYKRAKDTIHGHMPKALQDRLDSAEFADAEYNLNPSFATVWVPSMLMVSFVDPTKSTVPGKPDQDANVTMGLFCGLAP